MLTSFREEIFPETRSLTNLGDPVRELESIEKGAAVPKTLLYDRHH
jgi:hypothetical protein